jgi:hypothetical protein
VETGAWVAAELNGRPKDRITVDHLRSSVGFFKRLLGGEPPVFPGEPPSASRFAADDVMGVPVTPAQNGSGPFPKTLRVRALYGDYALYGSWQVVTINSPEDWSSVQDLVRGAYYNQFGLIHLADGSKAIRWNETTWRGVRETLEFLYDPRYKDPALGAAGSSHP